MVRVLIIAPTLTKGGMERQLSIFLEKYDRTQLKATLAILKDNVQYNIPEDVPLIIFNKKYKLDFLFYYRLISLLLSNKYDVINSKLSGMNEMLMMLCGVLRKKNLVIEIRSAGEHVLPFYKKMSKLYNTFKINWTIICNSNKAISELHEYVPASVPVRLVRNGINIDKFKQIPELKTSNKRIVLGFTGSIRPVKNIRLLIEAVGILNKKYNKQVILEIVGHVRDNEYYKSLLSLIQVLNIEENIHWVGTLDDVEQFYNKIDICVLPSFHEGTPNVLLEAMSCKCFCLISKAANSDDFLEEGFIFDENNPESLVEKVLWYEQLADEQRKEVGETNRTFIKKHYQIDVMVETYTQILIDSSKS